MPKSCRYYINISRSRESAFERLNEVKSKARRFFLGQSEFHQTKWTGRSDIVLFAYFQPNVNLINYCVQVDHVTFRASDSISNWQYLHTYICRMNFVHTMKQQI